MKTVEKKDIVVRAPIEELDGVVKSNLLIGQALDLELLNKYGVFVIKNLFIPEDIKVLRSEYDRLMIDGGIKKDQYHRTQVRVEGVSIFENFFKNNSLELLLTKIFPEGFGLDFYRVIKKDKSNDAPVFMHSDACYNVGWYDAYSIFIPLSKINIDNGGISFYPGTNNFGHVGDAGELANVLPQKFPVLNPEVDIGDAVVMHAGVWHKSPEFISGDTRVYFELSVRSINDPGMKIPLRGYDSRDWILKISVDDLFCDSREQRVRRLSEQLKSSKN
jgi:hypothetical protein